MNSRIEKLLAFHRDNPKDSFINHALGLEYVKDDDEVLARRYFETNLNGDPAYVATYYHLAKLYERIGERNRAIQTYEAGMKIAREVKDNHTYNELLAAYEDLVY